MTADRFPLREETFQGVPIRYVDLSALNVKNDGVIRLDGELASRFRPLGELILAFSPGCFHTFIIAGDTEYHSRLFHNRTDVRPAVAGSIKAGLFLRFPGFSAERITALRDFLVHNHGIRTPSCIFGSLRMLAEGADIHFVEPKRSRRMYLRPTLATLFTHGFRDSRGQPVPFEIYKVKPNTMEGLAREMRRTELRYGPVAELEYLPYLIYTALLSLRAKSPLTATGA